MPVFKRKVFVSEILVNKNIYSYIPNDIICVDYIILMHKRSESKICNISIQVCNRSIYRGLFHMYGS